MESLKSTLRQMIPISETELTEFLSKAVVRTFRRQDVISHPGAIPNEIFFVLEGLIRIYVIDNKGNEQSIYFAYENQFIADYSNYILQRPATYTLEAMEKTQVVVLPRHAIDWGYQYLKEGQKLGRLIAEYYFIYQDERIRDNYLRTPKERYDNITAVFPNIHNRVPQHMIASYLGITPIHLSRLKKEALLKT